MNIVKNLLRIPAFVALALIWFISYVFVFRFLPMEFKETTLSYCLILAFFGYFSIMTQVFLIAVFFSDPGYLPASLKRARINNLAPL